MYSRDIGLFKCVWNGPGVDPIDEHQGEEREVGLVPTPPRLRGGSRGPFRVVEGEQTGEGERASVCVREREGERDPIDVWSTEVSSERSEKLLFDLLPFLPTRGLT